MHHVLDWFGSGIGPAFVFGALFAALGITAIAPPPIKKRMRPGLLLGGIWGVLMLIASTLGVGTPGRTNLEAIAVFCAAFAVARIVIVVTIDLAWERAGQRPMNQLVRDVLQTGLYLLAAGSALRASGIPPTSLIATGTVVTAIVGLALQETLGNLASGVSIQIDKPISLGEWIRVDKADITGRVVSTNWRAVTIQSDDRLLYSIPNGFFAKNPFINYSRPGASCRRNLYFTMPYEVPPNRVREAILAACDDAPDVLKDPAPSVLTWTYQDYGIQYWLRFYIADFAFRDRAQSDVATRVWFHLHRRKLEAALPIQKQLVHRVNEKTIAARDEEVIKDRRAAIEGVDFLAPLSPEAKDMLAREGHRKLFAPNETILRAGETGREFYIVRRGKVRIRIGDEDLATLGPGQFFGEMALLTAKARFAHVIAAEETEVFELDESMFREVLHGQPAIAEEISRIVAERQAALESRRAGSGPASQQSVKSTTTEILSRIRDLFGLG